MGPPSGALGWGLARGAIAAILERIDQQIWGPLFGPPLGGRGVWGASWSTLGAIWRHIGQS
eukprot:2239918-Pyramimonas_sp.AAC.1